MTGFDAVGAQEIVARLRDASTGAGDEPYSLLEEAADHLELAVAEVTRLNSERDQALRIMDVTDNPNAEGWKLQRLHALFAERSTEPESEN